MGLAVLVPIGPGAGGELQAVGPRVRVDGARAANDVAADAERAGASHLVVVPTGPDPDRDPGAPALAVDGASGAGPDASPEVAAETLAIAAVSGLGAGAALRCSDGGVVAIALSALLAIGGFDPDQPGLGWLDLVDRLHRSGSTIEGVPLARLPFVPSLTNGLDPAERVVSEGRWLATRATDRAGRRRRDRHLRLVGRTVERLRHGLGPGTTPASVLLDRIEDAAARSWRGLAPDEAKNGIGRRADWRHLLPERSPGSPRSLVVLLGFGRADGWRWLVDDGWATRVDDRLPATPSADVVVIGPGTDGALADQIPAAVTALAREGSLCVMVTGSRRLRAIGRHRRLVAELRRSGLPVVRRHLALPDAGRAKRYVPLDHPGGMAWLAGPAPALGAASLPPPRRLLRSLAGRLGSLSPELIGDVVLVATSRPDRDAEPGHDPKGTDDGGWGHRVVITSGFDEGSRAVLLPLDDGAARPSVVVKVAARPAYGANGQREQERLRHLASEVERPGLVPEPRGDAECDGLPAVVEGYAGRWTMADVVNEQTELHRRAEVLDVVLRSVTALNRTGSRHETWNAEGFQDLIGRWFQRLDTIEGRSSARTALRDRLAERSLALDGRSLLVGLRHFDLGPWNVVLADAATASADRSPVTVVDWELGPPREGAEGPIGTDQLYLTKYWLHIAMGCRSIDEEQSAFAFLADDGPTGGGAGDGDPRLLAKRAMRAVAEEIGLPVGFLPLLEAGVWAEAACSTATRRRGRGGDGGSPSTYLATLARRRTELLTSWG